jgi:hypothetical protein
MTENNVIINTKIDLVFMDEKLDNWYKCPKCKCEQIRYHQNYCFNCGVKFTWVYGIQAYGTDKFY